MTPEQVLKYEAPLVILALVIAVIMAFFPTGSYLKQSEASSWYIIQKQAAPVQQQHRHAAPVRSGQPVKEKPALTPAGDEGC